MHIMNFGKNRAFFEQKRHSIFLYNLIEFPFLLFTVNFFFVNILFLNLLSLLTMLARFIGILFELIIGCKLIRKPLKRKFKQAIKYFTVSLQKT